MLRLRLFGFVVCALIFPSGFVFSDAIDDRVDRLNEYLKDLPTVVAERRAEMAVLTGWTRTKQEKKLLGTVLKMEKDVEDFTGDDLDDPNRMVEIDVAIVVVLNTDQTSVGFDFLQLVSVNFDYFKTSHLLGKDDNALGLTKPGNFGTSGIVPGTQWGQFFHAKVDYSVNIANATDDRVSIIARPHLASLNGEKAEFMAGGEIVFKVSGVNSGRIQPYPYGIQLAVTPTILRTRDAEGRTQVLLDIDASRLTVLDLATVAAKTSSDDVSFDKVQVRSKALLPMGETLILSGLYQREHRNIHSGVPFLRKIPIIKYFFSNKSEIDEVLSTIIFVTPREPGVLTEHSLDNLNKFIERRKEYVHARELGGQALNDFKTKYSDWYKPQKNRYASHFFLVDKNSIYRELRGEDLRTEKIRSDIMSVSKAD